MSGIKLYKDWLQKQNFYSALGYVEKAIFENVYLYDLLNAFFAVENIYQRWTYLGSDDQINERPFCYELYHQYRRIMELNIADKYSNIILNAEIHKNGILLRGEFMRDINFNSDEIKGQFNELMSTSFSPDMVLHQGQDTCDPETHKLFIEVKAKNTNNGYKKDLLKCLVAIQGMKYDFGVFITLNRSKDVINRDVAKIYNDNKEIFRPFEESFDKLIILGREYNDNIIIFNRFKNIINE